MTLVLGGHLSGGKVVWQDSCPRGTVVLGEHLSRGTAVQGDYCPGRHLSGGQMSQHNRGIVRLMIILNMRLIRKWQYS